MRWGHPRAQGPSPVRLVGASQEPRFYRMPGRRMWRDVPCYDRMSSPCVRHLSGLIRRRSGASPAIDPDRGPNPAVRCPAMTYAGAAQSAVDAHLGALLVLGARGARCAPPASGRGAPRFRTCPCHRTVALAARGGYSSSSSSSSTTSRHIPPYTSM